LEKGKHSANDRQNTDHREDGQEFPDTECVFLTSHFLQNAYVYIVSLFKIKITVKTL
jgi:hypothetical protein